MTALPSHSLFYKDQFVPQAIPFTRFFLDESNSSNIHANGNYSTTPKKFILQPSATEIIYIYQVLVFIRDSGIVDSGFYGNNISLTNGVRLSFHQFGQKIAELTEEFQIKTNIDFAAFGFSIVNHAFGQGDQYIQAVLNVSQFGSSLKMDGDKQTQLIFELNDDFTGLNDHLFVAMGYTSALVL